MDRVLLGDCVEIIGGQVMSRIAAKADVNGKAVETRKVVVPKCINADGSIDVEEMTEELLKAAADVKKLTQVGDIVIKLSPPYDAAIVDDTAADCLVPSFCAIVRGSSKVDIHYLLAFLNSELCKRQLATSVAGAVMTVLSVGKIKNIYVPMPGAEQQHEIGQRYMGTQRKLRIIRKIGELEAKRNDIVFKEMVKDDDE